MRSRGTEGLGAGRDEGRGPPGTPPPLRHRGPQSGAARRPPPHPAWRCRGSRGARRGPGGRGSRGAWGAAAAYCVGDAAARARHRLLPRRGTGSRTRAWQRVASPPRGAGCAGRVRGPRCPRGEAGACAHGLTPGTRLRRRGALAFWVPSVAFSRLLAR